MLRGKKTKRNDKIITDVKAQLTTTQRDIIKEKRYFTLRRIRILAVKILLERLTAC